MDKNCETYDEIIARERFNRMKRLANQDYRCVFKARCMALVEVCDSMVSRLECEEDPPETWDVLHALIECAKVFVETDIPLYRACEDDERERKRGEY